MINENLIFLDVSEFRKRRYEINLILKSYDFKNSTIWKHPNDVSHSDTIIVDNELNIIGLINVELINENMEFRINHFEINPKYRNKGYGTQVFKQLIEVFDYISIVIDKETFPAYFYVKMGFNRIIETKDTTLLIMDKMK